MFFFFKQKTAYEMRISDWSSDVYSSDLTLSFLHAPSSARSSLSLDLAEPFKPCLTDSIIFKALKKKMLADNWFDQKKGVCLLTDVGRKQVIALFCSMSDSHKYDERTYRSEIRIKAITCKRHVLDK